MLLSILDVRKVRLAKNKNFNYNVENPDGELISDIWFSEISYELNRDKDGIYFICYDYINDKIYNVKDLFYIIFF